MAVEVRLLVLAEQALPVLAVGGDGPQAHLTGVDARDEELAAVGGPAQMLEEVAVALGDSGGGCRGGGLGGRAGPGLGPVGSLGVRRARARLGADARGVRPAGGGVRSGSGRVVRPYALTMTASGPFAETVSLLPYHSSRCFFSLCLCASVVRF